MLFETGFKCARMTTHFFCVVACNLGDVTPHTVPKGFPPRLNASGGWLYVERGLNVGEKARADIFSHHRGYEWLI